MTKYFRQPACCSILAMLLLIFPTLGFGQEPAETPATEGVVVPAPDQAAAAPKGWDPATVAAGKAAFENGCISCHDANRSLDKKKGLSGWRATIQRMATKDGADIPENTWESMAVYLTAKDQPAGPGGGGSVDAAAAVSDPDPLSIFGTLSPLWRGGNANLQNPGFFPDVWLGAAWQTTSSPVSGRVTACLSCHNEPGLGSRIELVEAVIRLDLTKWLNKGCAPCDRDMSIALEAGRIVVPFGAFSKQVNPGVYRTVSKPLIYNMGQRVYDEDLGDPVLPISPNRTRTCDPAVNGSPQPKG